MLVFIDVFLPVSSGTFQRQAGKFFAAQRHVPILQLPLETQNQDR
jgi:hypothetical protein